MTTEGALSKAQRLIRISHYLYRNPQGLSASELAALCGVHKRTINRDLLALGDAGIPIAEDDGAVPRYQIIKGYYVPPLHLNLDDALALYLGARLLSRYADAFDPHVAEALAKLAGILPETIAAHVHDTIRHMGEREENQQFVRVLNALALGWETRRKVRIRHRSAKSDHVHGYVLCPYFIEPSAAGNATYVIGHSSYWDALHTFKIERIMSAELMNERFELPEDFDGPALLEEAWGVMYGGEKETVRLRFAPSATRRLCETHWHPSQELVFLDDGGCELRLELTNAQEMIYWVRGWGAQVEVIEPDWMCKEMVEEIEKMTAVYGKESA